MPKPKTADDKSARIVSLKESGKTWAEISNAVGLPQGKCMFLYEAATVTPKNKITAKSEEDLKKKIAAARGEGLSWGVISARSGKSEGYCRAAFTEVTGEAASGNRIGKGGRYPGADGAAKPVKKAAAKKATKSVKKAAAPAPAKKAVKKALATKKATGAVKKAAAKKAVKKALAEASA